MVTIELAPNPVAPRERDGYVAVMRFMHGDADQYTTEEMRLDSEDELKLFVETMAWLHEVDPHYNRLGSYKRNGTYERTITDPRYAHFFQSYTEADFLEDKAKGVHRVPKETDTWASVLKLWGEDFWPTDRSAGDGPAAYEGSEYYQIINGVRHKLRVTYTKDA